MKKNLIGLLCVLLLCPFTGLPQAYTGRHRFFSLNFINGELRLGGIYRYQAGYSGEIYNTLKSTWLTGGVMLNTNSSFFNPGFISLDLGGEYNPEIGRELYLVVPDQAEVRTMKKFNATMTFFRQRKFNFSGFFNYNDVYSNRDNLSNIRSNNINYGGNLSWSNNILPIQGSYLQTRSYETEVPTNRIFITNQQNIQVHADKSFGKNDNNQLIYYHSDYARNDMGLSGIRNTSDNLNLNSNVYLDKNRNYNLGSSISGIDQYGSEAFRRYQLNENLNLKLPARLTLNAAYNLFSYTRAFQSEQMNSVRGNLWHQLYGSLRSGLSFEYNRIIQTFYKETNIRPGIDITYEKKIPLKGKLILGYAYTWMRQDHTSSPVEQPILHEEHRLTDGQMTLLSKSFIEVPTIVVKDATGTIIYQLNFDYVLIPRNDFIEIQRVPGGQIQDKSLVYVDYVAMIPGSYRYDMNFQSINASISLFNRLVELYFKLSDQRYTNLQTTEFLTLNRFTQTIYGCRIGKGAASGGAEYELYASTIVPYRLIHYYVQVQGSFKNNITYSVNGDMRDYYLTDEHRRQQFIDVTGNVAYLFSAKSSISAEFGFRKQAGLQIDLSLLTGRIQYSGTFRQIIFRIGAEVYGRNYLGEHTNFLGGFIRIIRTFNWQRK